MEAFALETLESVGSLRAEWDDLLARCPGSPLFRTPEWVLTWYEVLADRFRPLVLAFRESGRLIGLLPLARRRDGRRIEFAGEALASGDHLGLVARAEELDRLWDAAAGLLEPELRRARVLRLAMLDRGPEVEAARRAADRRGWTVVASAGIEAPVARLPSDPEDLLRRLRKKRRADVRRRRRDLEQREGAAFSTITGAEDVGTGLEILFALHAARWRSRGSEGTLGDPVKRRFLGTFCRSAAERGWLRLHVCRARGRPIGALLAFHRDGTASYLQSGWDPEFRRYGVGELLVLFGMEEAVREGLRWFDFLRGDEPYKARWSTETRTLVTLEAACRLPGRAELRLRALASGLRRRLRARLAGDRRAEGGR
ncbi:MAG: GNAT family N-acetyltransferase [Acidobacteria bacterium]|nr:MAG: GNAT family N-acetyltransferase [Acidobacteriota bacterium]